MYRYTITKIFTGLSLVFSLLNADITKIMPLGDSITYDDLRSDSLNFRPAGIRTAYRSHLWYMLQDANFPADFVGSQVAGQDISPPFDANNEGHPGWTSYDISETVYQFLADNHADTILLHIGTNDRSSSVSGVNSILNEIDRYERDTGTHVRVIIALIIGRSSVGNATIESFNANLSNLVNHRINTGDMLTLVDMYHNAGLTAEDYAETTHPNSEGYAKMATVWFNTLMLPYSRELHAYPSSIVSTEYIQGTVVDEAAKSVSFLAQVPDTGITF